MELHLRGFCQSLTSITLLCLTGASWLAKPKQNILGIADRIYTEEPELWFHDVLRKVGTPYIPEEIALLQNNTSARKKMESAD